MLCKVKGSRYLYTRFTIGKKRVFRSTGTTEPELAEEFEQKLRDQLWKAKRLGYVRKSWEDAVVSWSLGRDVSIIRWHLVILDKYCKDRYLDELTDVRDNLVKDRLAKGIKTFKGSGVSHGTINKTLAIYRAILMHAKRKGWIEKVSVELLKDGEGRVRWITREESEKLISELPEHLRDMVRFSLATGLREQNVIRLEWSRVDLDRRVAWVQADDHKNREPHQIPLNAEAVLILRRHANNGSPWVFPYRGRVLWKINTSSWRKALKRAGIENFRVHDLRHTWASWHVQAGTPLPVLQKLGGWKTLSMVMKYAHLGASHVSEHADNICRPRVVKESAVDNVSCAVK